MAPEMQTNSRWIRSWLPWNRDRIFSLVATGAASGPDLSEGQESAVELLCREANTGLGSGQRVETNSALRLPRPRSLGCAAGAGFLPEGARHLLKPLQWAHGSPKTPGTCKRDLLGIKVFAAALKGRTIPVALI